MIEKVKKIEEIEKTLPQPLPGCPQAHLPLDPSTLDPLGQESRVEGSRVEGSRGREAWRPPGRVGRECFFNFFNFFNYFETSKHWKTIAFTMKNWKKSTPKPVFGLRKHSKTIIFSMENWKHRWFINSWKACFSLKIQWFFNVLGGQK